MDRPGPQHPPVSVVTPVYNGEEFIAECIESVLEQTYEQWEYVIVNNCSTDRTREIAEGYARQDPRIRIHDNDAFLSAFDNLNHAMRQIASGSRYCKVIHADDALFPDCIRRMVELAERHPNVGIVGSFVQKGDEVTGKWVPPEGNVIRGAEICRLSLLGTVPYLFGSPSSLLIRSDLVRGRDPFYPKGEHALIDQMVCYELLRDADFGYVPEVLSFTRLHDDSLTARKGRVNTSFAGKLEILARYGPVYLSSAEHAGRHHFWVDRYYNFLGGKALQRPGRAFWSYHRNAFRDLGLRFERGRLVRAALSTVAGRLASRKRAWSARLAEEER